MPPGFSDDFKELVRSRTDLVELVGETVTLQSRGGNDYIGLCPFHDDHNPSFHVYPERQSYRCWVCQEGGDCFSWMMKVEAVEFPEALEMLAGRARLELPKSQRGGGSQNRQDKNRLFEVLAWAENEFHRCFLSAPEAAPARDYMGQRGFSHETLTKFHVGYHPADWEWLLRRGRQRFSPEQLHAARLVRERKDGSGYYDDFVERVLFPIRDGRGQTVAFGGRILPHAEKPEVPKYLNSPESILFTKSRLLYGFDVAREAVRRSGTVVVVEGYTDCMMAQQYGLTNVVGTLGTALTETHVSELKRFARKVVLVYDGDEAGQNAAERSLVKFLSQKVDLRVLTLPAGTDPADFLGEHGADAFRERIDGASEALEYKLRLSIDRYGLETVDGRHRILEEMLDLLARAPQLSGTDRENLLLGKLAHRFALPEPAVRQRLTETRRKLASRKTDGSGRTLRVDSEASPPRRGSSEETVSKDVLTEIELLEIIFVAGEWTAAIRAEVKPSDFKDEHRRQLLQFCFDLFEQGVVPSFERVMAGLESPELKSLTVMIDQNSREKEIKQKLFEEDHPLQTDGLRPRFLEQTLRNLKSRKEKETHELSKGQLAQLSGHSEGSSLDKQEQLRLLSQAQKFHENRAAKKTLT